MINDISSPLNSTPTLEELGWRPALAAAYRPHADHCIPGRVGLENRGCYLVLTARGELQARVTGKFMHEAVKRLDYPALGDWVVLSMVDAHNEAVIHGILPRFSKFSRQAAGKVTEEQVAAANVDLVFLCLGLDGDYNIRRLERYLVMAWESGAFPVVVLTKADLCPDLPARLSEAASIAAGADIIAVSGLDGQGLEALRGYLVTGKTGVLLGSSGVGKSTLINELFGKEVQTTNAVRAADSKGRHTTTHRELFLLPGGGLLIDTPGMRELQLLQTPEGLEEAFEDIEALAPACRFKDCNHRREPGCAVKTALAEGSLREDRYQSYLKLQKEMVFAGQKAAQKSIMLAKATRKTVPRQKQTDYATEQT